MWNCCLACLSPSPDCTASLTWHQAHVGHRVNDHESPNGFSTPQQTPAQSPAASFCKPLLALLLLSVPQLHGCASRDAVAAGSLLSSLCAHSTQIGVLSSRLPLALVYKPGLHRLHHDSGKPEYFIASPYLEAITETTFVPPVNRDRSFHSPRITRTEQFH